jgi:GT2 family glycosyltransferase
MTTAAVSATSTSTTTSVIVCAYSDARWDALADVVAALGRQTLPPTEVVLCIDHNPDLLARARNAFASARVIPSEEQPGLSGARNTGIRHASGDIIAFIDDDALPEPQWLEELVTAFDDPVVVGAGGVALPGWLEGSRPDWLPPEMDWVVGCSYVGLPDGVAEIRNPIGANMAFRAGALAAVGGFCDGVGRIGAVPLGCEETDLSIRVRRDTGGSILHIPRARVVHRVPRTRVTWRYFLSRCWHEGLSKAFVARRTGATRALESELRYATRTLPRGFFAGLGKGLRGDLGGVVRSAAIVAGLIVTTAGYARGRMA